MTIDCSAANTCMNEGTCNDAGNACLCEAGFTGELCGTATTPATRMQGTLQCYSCSTNSITDVCSTADDLASGSGVLTPTCYEGQSCWTDHYENSSHTVVSRGCTDDQCNTYHEGGGPYCTMANGGTSCTSCCTASKCNDNKSSSEGLTSSCVTWLTSLFSVVIIIITYRT
ncbi:multiple epidermal growth factor-like domains protein 10 [Strongylocentrotus purpuratus]|uniref:EGF-like domain-containing protein n=1 Tax=Strongylocentrotus purpuratus TaxID=7668 RepID=A0A7M7PPV6_STRPU|nr:multiple epidermal growth factor-like domains protein 10 [Strongylocentrotus purpuratus]